jgi:hypothetical protein
VGDLRDGRQVRVAEREIADLVGPEFLLELDPGLEHASNPGRALDAVADIRADHLHGTTFPIMVARGGRIIQRAWLVKSDAGSTAMPWANLPRSRRGEQVASRASPQDDGFELPASVPPPRGGLFGERLDRRHNR